MFSLICFTMWSINFSGVFGHSEAQLAATYTCHSGLCLKTLRGSVSLLIMQFSHAKHFTPLSGDDTAQNKMPERARKEHSYTISLRLALKCVPSALPQRVRECEREKLRKKVREWFREAFHNLISAAASPLTRL